MCINATGKANITKICSSVFAPNLDTIPSLKNLRNYLKATLY